MNLDRASNYLRSVSSFVMSVDFSIFSPLPVHPHQLPDIIMQDIM
jgi:hypothetical protein